jgi:hypothetical protein
MRWRGKVMVPAMANDDLNCDDDWAASPRSNSIACRIELRASASERPSN